MSMSDEDALRLWEYRKKRFKIEVKVEEPKNYTANNLSIYIAVTGNGNQFAGFTVYGIDELQAVADVVNQKLKELKND